MKNIAIIPARSGSKGLPNKNIIKLGGKPMMSYSIEAAINSGCFEEVMVSTDSNEYAEIAMHYGANVPFLRSEETSSDEASSWDMVIEVLNQYINKGLQFDTFCLLQPTSPLRTAKDIKNAYNLYYERNSLSVVSVCEAEHSPLLYGKISENALFINYINSEFIGRRQDMEKYYRLNGAIYIVDAEGFMSRKSINYRAINAYIMPRERSVDIDTKIDFMLAEELIKGKNDWLETNTDGVGRLDVD